MVGMRVLIADDNVAMRAMLEKFIGQIGNFAVDFAGTGSEALRFYRQSHHDLIILDNIMPNKNGIDVLRELKDDPLLDQTHVIMIIGEVNKTLISTIRSECLKIDDLIVKPIDFIKLKGKVSGVATRIYRKNRTDGPLLRAADPIPENILIKPTLSAEIIDRGRIAILELKGDLTSRNRTVIGDSLKMLQTIFAKTVVIDLNSVQEADEFGYGTLAVMGGWLSINDKEAFLSCENTEIRKRLASLHIDQLVPEYQGALDPFSITDA